jgi:hypothetical protein
MREIIESSPSDGRKREDPKILLIIPVDLVERVGRSTGAALDETVRWTIVVPSGE